MYLSSVLVGLALGLGLVVPLARVGAPVQAVAPGILQCLFEFGWLVRLASLVVGARRQLVVLRVFRDWEPWAGFFVAVVSAVLHEGLEALGK